VGQYELRELHGAGTRTALEAFQAGDVVTWVLMVQYGGSPLHDPDEYARRLAAIREVRIKIEFRYSRSIGWLRRMLPRNRRRAREEVRGHIWARFDGKALRNEIGNY
jgi:hypothetical protein